ncbi:STYKc [Nesidiocoris tenuis]|uniref:STYKc n=1 Tax=Nesidiocoris tenuis TaxID=355587 RepID=A0ABN7AM06_9HEMI|nr:STYKc [Nesidiocoris tenuis]
MWLFTRDTTKDFPYDIIEADDHFDQNGLFTLRQGIHKVTKDVVSVFCHNKKDVGCTEARAALKRLKTLRHPNILTYIDSKETDAHLLIVTEHVKPLLTYLSTIEDGKGKQLYLSWGLMNIFKGVAFLNHSASLAHDGIGIEAVFVNSAGEWKLGGFTSTKELSADKSWNEDSYGLGKLIWEAYNAKRNEDPNQLNNQSKIPGPIRQTYQGLISSPHRRLSALKVLEKGRAAGGCFQNDLVDAMVFLDEIHIKNKEEVNLFFRNIQQLLKDMPKCTAEFKILPQLIKAYDFGCEGTCVLPPLFEITTHISDRHFQTEVVPFLTKVFGSVDRATRSLLLQNLERFIDRIPSNVINDSLFPQVLNGFMDTNPRIREQTVKAMIHIAPKLNDKNLNTELMTHFARLLSKDDQGGIRTNTIVCLSKIGHCLNPQNRRVILMSAFLRSLNDPFPPVRNAGTLGLAVSQQYFALEDVSKRILPALCSLTLDPDPAVRESVFKTIKGFLSNLENVSENPELRAQMDAEALSSKKPSSSWAEWATAAITSKFSLKMDRKIEPDNADEPKEQKKSITDADNGILKRLSPIDDDLDTVVPDNRPALPPDPAISISEKMKYTTFNAEEDDNWGSEFWEPIEDEPLPDETRTKSPTTVSKPAISVRSSEERKKSKSGPMKLGTRLNQPKFD